MRPIAGDRVDRRRNQLDGSCKLALSRFAVASLLILYSGACGGKSLVAPSTSQAGSAQTSGTPAASPQTSEAPFCDDLNLPKATVDAAVIAAIDPTTPIWHDPVEYSAFLVRVENTLGCTFTTAGGMSSATASARPVIQTAPVPSDVYYCGLGNSTSSPLPFLVARNTSSYLTAACRNHDSCYSASCTSLLCYFTVSTLQCDAPLRDACSNLDSGSTTADKVICSLVVDKMSDAVTSPRSAACLLTETQSCKQAKSAKTLRVDGQTFSGRAQGESFAYSGTNFGENQKVIRYIKAPDGAVTKIDPTITFTADSNGAIAWVTHTDCTSPTGQYLVYAVDSVASDPSNEVTQWIHPNAACAATPLPAPQAPRDSVDFLSQLVPDGTPLMPGADLRQEWRLHNSGTSAWTGYSAVFVSAPHSGNTSRNLTVPMTTTLPVAFTAPGQDAIVSASMKAPSTPGTYYSYWQLQNSAGERFGVQFFIELVVSSSATVPTPAPTPSPSPTPSPAGPPTATTIAASNINTTTATLNGTVNSNGLATSISFQWGTTTSYGNATASQSISSGSTSIGVTANLAGLTASATYHYRLVATNSAGTTNGNDVAFSTASQTAPSPTPTAAPTISSISPSSVIGGTFDLTINGSGFDAAGAVDQVYQPNGSFMGQGTIRSRSGTTQIIVTESMAGAAPFSQPYAVKVKNPDGQLSNGLGLTLYDQVNVSPGSGNAGTVFSYTGQGFTGSFGVTSHLKRPDGTEFSTKQIATNASGQFSDTIDSTGFSAGTYEVWAIDNNTGVSSAHVTLAVSVSVCTPTLNSISPSSVIGSTFTLTANGNCFDGAGAVVEVYQPNGSFMGNGTVTSRSTTQIVTTQSMAGAAPGTYTIKILNSNGLRSNGLGLTLYDQASVSPGSGSAGTVFSYTGQGFTGSFGVTSHLKRPNGTEFSTLQIATAANGTFGTTINSVGFAIGTYEVWAIDNNTGVSSAHVTFSVH